MKLRILKYFLILILINSINVQAQTLNLTTKWYDGSTMTDSKVDNYIYTKKNGKYYKLSSLTKGYDVKIFDAKGDGNTDDTKAINKAISVCSKLNLEVYISKGIYRINADSMYTGVNLVDNAVINFDKDAIFKASPNKSNFYTIIRIYDVKNVVINNPRIIGDRDFHKGKGGEWGYGIHIENAENITINNGIITNCWGDGIYIGNKMYDNRQRFSTKKIIINSPYVDNCRRNGISVCMGEDITVKDAVIKNINGTLPQAGIDIEPEWDRGILPIVFNNIKIINPITENCKGDGIQLYLNLLADKGLESNIDIINHNDFGSNTGITFYKTFGVVSGKINISDPIWKNNKTHGLKMIDYTYNGPPMVYISNPKFINWNKNNSKESRLTSAISLVSEERKSNKIGNMIMTSPSFIKEVSNANKDDILNITNVTKGLGNLQIKNVEKIINVDNIIEEREGLQIIDKNNKLLLKKKRN